MVGHPRRGEAYASSHHRRITFDPRLEEAREDVLGGVSLSRAARDYGASPERLRMYLQDSGVRKTRIGWSIKSDRRRRAIVLYSRGREVEVVLPGFTPAQQAGRFMAFAGIAVDKAEAQYLQPFIGKGVRDVKGTFHPFETDLNELFRLTSAGPIPDHLAYRFVVT